MNLVERLIEFDTIVQINYVFLLNWLFYFKQLINEVSLLNLDFSFIDFEFWEKESNTEQYISHDIHNDS